MARENQSRRDPVKVAQYEVLKSYPSRLVRHSQDAAFALRAMARPQTEGRASEATAGRRRNGTIDQRWQTLIGARDQKPSVSIVSRDERVFLHHFPALRTGLLSLSPSGT